MNQLLLDNIVNHNIVSQSNFFSLNLFSIKATWHTVYHKIR